MQPEKKGESPFVGVKGQTVGRGVPRTLLDPAPSPKSGRCREVP